MTTDIARLLATDLARIEDEYAVALAAPLSARKALLVLALLDAYVERMYATRRDAGEHMFGAEDLPAYRAALAERHPALGEVFAFGAQRGDGPTLVTRAIEVPIASYPALSVEDFMVSLYNGNTVQRVVLAGPEGERLVHDVLGEAVAAVRTL